MPEAEHHRRSPRLPHYDYGQAGAYFVTVCVKDRKAVLGEVVGEVVELTAEGNIVQAIWNELPEHYDHIELDEFVVMPNHIHGIVWIKEREDSNVGAQHAAPLQPKKDHPHVKSGSLGAIVRSFKSAATRKINQLHKSPGTSFWQRGYYEHIIRNDDDLQHHRQYIIENPLKWSLDEYHREALYA